MARRSKQRNSRPTRSALISGILTSSGVEIGEDPIGELVAMLGLRPGSLSPDLDALAPEGSFLKRITRPFRDTDISYALPIFETIMIAAAWLTQSGAHLVIPGLEPVRPTLWLIGLAESGSAKSLASSRLSRVLREPDGSPSIAYLPTGSTDAQWIKDLSENNYAHWHQDETGKFFRAVLRDKLLARMKPWILAAYGNDPIEKRALSDEVKIRIEDPGFTFHGLSVLSTWRADIDAVSMLDGFCQRPNYYIAPRRTDTDMFDHFIYFQGEGILEMETDLRETWNALCAQPGASGAYHLAPGALTHLQDWWRGLRSAWEDSTVPASFIRRIGFSVLRYLVVLQFLLGKSRHPIDVETAELATRYAEFHLEGARKMLQSYDRDATTAVQLVHEKRDRLISEGREVSVRAIHRSLSKAQREHLDARTIEAILGASTDSASQPGAVENLLGGNLRLNGQVVSEIRERLARIHLNERKRNEWRLRKLRSAWSARATSRPGLASGAVDERGVGARVVPLRPARTDKIRTADALTEGLPMSHG